MIRSLIFHILLTASLTAGETVLAPPAPFVPGKTPAASIAGGVDFGANNDQRVIPGPGRNLLNNPSMESGLRYFTPPRGYQYYGDFPLALNTGDARSGKHSLHVTWESGPVATLGIPVRPDSDYTISCYVKSKTGKKPHILCRILKSATQRKDTILLPFKPTGENDNGWLRYAATFRSPAPILLFQFWPEEELLYDDLQLETGSRPTPYAGNPVGMEFQSESPENAIIDSARNVKTSLLLRGPAGLSGRCRITDSDFFRRKQTLGEFEFTFDERGEHRITLPDSEKFTEGIHTLTVEFRSGQTPAFTDFVRFAKFRYASNQRRNSTLHGQRGSGRLYRNERFAGIWTCFGFSTLPYNNVPYPYSRENPGGLPANTKEDYAFLQKHNIVDWGSSLFHHPWQTDDTYLNGVKIEENGVPLIKLKNYSKAILKQVEEEAAKLAASRPHVKVWQSDTEPICIWQTLQDHNYTEYARLQLALTRGLKRGSPTCEHMPMGHYTMYQEGRDQVTAFLSAAKKLDPSIHYRFIEIHTYRPFPELPDTDADIAEFIRSLAKIGYPDIRIRLGEGAYFYPFIAREYHIAPWESTQNKDMFQCMTIPSYDLGWGEQVGAAMVLRTMLAAYKYTPNVVQMLPWLVHTVDEQTPFAWAVANANLSNLLGDSTFRRDIRFAPDCRAYLFDDGHEGVVAALWKFREEMDRGSMGGVPMTLNTGELPSLELIDMMGNRFPAEKQEGKLRIPLSNFPFFLRVAARDAAALEKAILHAEVPDDSERPPLRASLLLKTRTEIAVKLENPLSRTLEPELSIDGASFRKFNLGANTTTTITVPLKQPIPFDRFTDIAVQLEFRLDGKISWERLTTCAIAVSHVPETFPFDRSGAWNQLPAVKIPYYHNLRASHPLKGNNDFHAAARFAWNKTGLYLRFEVGDDQFCPAPENIPVHARWSYETIQLYFDAYGDARAKLKNNSVGYGEDDFSYELIPQNEKSMLVFRRDAPDHQLTGGVLGGLLPNRIVPEIPAAFSWYNQKIRFYTVKFPARYLMPLSLKTGSSAGIGISIWDRDGGNAAAPVKAVLQNVNPLSGSPFRSPHLYPQFLLVP